MVQILSIFNAKGGVAKTTTAVSVSAALALTGKRTLLIDLDAQGSAGLSLGVSRAELDPGIADVLISGKPIETIVRSSAIPNLDLVTASLALVSADIVLADKKNRELVLKVALQPIRDRYEFIILDCPPALNLVSVNSLLASAYYIVPTSPDYLSLEGLSGLLQATEKIQAGIGDSAECLGIVLTQADSRLNVTREIEELIRKAFGPKVFKTVIPSNVRTKEAPSFGQSIFEYAPESSGAIAYKELTREILNRLRNNVE